jgi:hypothetical protein
MRLGPKTKTATTPIMTISGIPKPNMMALLYLSFAVNHHKPFLRSA